MRRRLGRKRRRNTASDTPELMRPVVLRRRGADAQSPFYKSGPAFVLSNLLERQENGANPRSGLRAQSQETVPATLAPLTGRGVPSQHRVNASSVELRGETRADYDGGAFETQNVRVSAAETCDSCSDGDPCVRVRGVLVARYHVTTTVTLPSVGDFPDLTPCQRARVQNAIDNVLAPHEQEHVRAFRQYNGVTRTPFDLTICRSQFDSSIREMFENQERQRRASAQAASDALDPFSFTVDLDCEESSEDDEETKGDDS